MVVLVLVQSMVVVIGREWSGLGEGGEWGGWGGGEVRFVPLVSR